MSPIKILYVINNAEIGGGPRHLALLLRSLDREQFDVAVACTGGGAFLSSFVQQHARVFPIELMHWRHHVGAVRQLVQLIRQEQITLVHTHGTRAGLLGSLAAREAGVPSVYTLHASCANRHDQPLIRWAATLAEHLIGRLSSMVISVSDVNRRFFVDAGIVPAWKIVTIHNGLPFDEWRIDDQSGHRMEHTPTIGMIGRLDRQKGVLVFIRAAAEAYRLRPTLRFVIIGDGQLRGRAHALTRQLGLTDVVRFTGWVEKSQAAFAMVDIVVLPSLWEGLPYVALEGMALRKPIIAAQVNGLSEVIEHNRTGILVDPKDVHALAAAMIDLVDDPEHVRQLADAAASAVRARFDLTATVCQTMEVYRRVLNQ